MTRPENIIYSGELSSCIFGFMLVIRFLQSRSVTYLIAIVWIAFALLGKLVPVGKSHQQIVARVFGDEMSLILVRCIGLGELLVALWVISGFKKLWCGYFQIAVVAGMNCIELIVAKDLLLWGGGNAIFALMFVVTVYFNLVRPGEKTPL